MWRAGRADSTGQGAAARRRGAGSAARAWGVALLAAAIASGHPAHAQDVYELSDDGWQQQAEPPAGSSAAQLQEARRLLAQGEPKAAIELLDRWVEANPNHPLEAQARLVRGDAKVARKDLFAALFDYEYIARVFPASDQFMVALEREYEVARLFVNGVKRKLLGMRILPARGEGEELLIRIQERAPGSDVGERASILLGDYYFDAGEMRNAAEAYDLFILNYPDSRQREWAMLRLIQANLARFKGPGFDPTGLIEAGERLRLYAAEFPASADRIGSRALLARVEQSLARAEMAVARWYDRRGERVSAVALYRRVVADRPQTEAAREALDRLAEWDVPLEAPESGAGEPGAGSDPREAS